MRPSVPDDLLAKIGLWPSLSRWEKAQVGRALRRRGLSYGEIMELIPVPKGTLAGWCRDIRLSPGQVTAIRERTGSVRGVPRDTQWQRRAEVERIRADAQNEVASLITDPLWLAGTVMYWAEGNKRHRHFAMTNTDPAVLRLFTAWVRRFLDPNAEFALSLHLHAGNDEREARQFWRAQLDIPDAPFWKTHWKHPGTGQRTNRHSAGVCRIRVRRGTDSLMRVLGWIDAIRDLHRKDDAEELLSSSTGR
jgi:hypothetical protein